VVGCWELTVGSRQFAVDSWQLAVGSFEFREMVD